MKDCWFSSTSLQPRRGPSLPSRAPPRRGKTGLPAAMQGGGGFLEPIDDENPPPRPPEPSAPSAEDTLGSGPLDRPGAPLLPAEHLPAPEDVGPDKRPPCEICAKASSGWR